MSSVFVARKPLSRVDRGFNRKKSLQEKNFTVAAEGKHHNQNMVQYKPRTEKRPFFGKESKLGKRM